MYLSSTVLLRLVLDECAPARVVKGIGNGEYVLVATAGLVDDDHVVRRQLPHFLEETVQPKLPLSRERLGDVRGGRGLCPVMNNISGSTCLL